MENKITYELVSSKEVFVDDVLGKFNFRPRDLCTSWSINNFFACFDSLDIKERSRIHFVMKFDNARNPLIMRVYYESSIEQVQGRLTCDFRHDELIHEPKFAYIWEE